MAQEASRLGVKASLSARARLLAQSRAYPFLIAAAAMLLALPSLRNGLIMDDYYHRAVLDPQSPYRELLGPPAAMFRFFHGTPERTQKLVDLGVFPWWTDLYIKAEFLQAIPTLTHRLDYLLWPNSPALMHAQSVLWLGMLVATVAVVYRRLLGATAVAAVAALLYAVDDARGATVGFIANRNVLIAASFGFWAFYYHDRWRREGERPAAILSWILAALALVSKEEGIGIYAYLGAYALFLEPRGPLRGLVSLAPAAAVLVAWRMARSALGYGVWNMGLYIDPLTNPGPFLAALPERAIVLLFGQWGPAPAELQSVLDRPLAIVFAGVALAYLGLLVLVFAPLVKRDRQARFWLAGMVLAVVPSCATLPMDRLTTFVAFGAFGLLARFCAFVFDARQSSGLGADWRIPALVTASLLILMHAIAAPALFPLRAAWPLAPSWTERRLYGPDELPRDIARQTLVIVNAPSPCHVGYLPFKQMTTGGPVPRRVRVLAPATSGVLIRRVDNRTLEIACGKGYLKLPLDRVFRSERRPLAAGEEIALVGMTARVLELTGDNRPAIVRFRFDRPLESPDFAWYCFKENRFEPFLLPAVGREVAIDFDFHAFLSPPFPAEQPARH